MKHNLKFPDGTIKAVDCKLGSGITDKNGKEIFEGDIVKFVHHSDIETVLTSNVYFMNGTFTVVVGDCELTPLAAFIGFEIIGHVDD